MTHDPESLASAYLDGELTDDERRVAEADPALMAEVDELRALRAQLADVEPAGDATREAAIGAAMAAFHEQFPAAPPVAAVGAATAGELHDVSDDATVVPFFRRFAGPQWLGVAAAAVVLVVAVGVVATRGADDAESDLATAVLDSAADSNVDADRIAESELADDMFAGDADEPIAPMAEEPALESAEEPAEDTSEVTSEMSTEMAADEPADEPADGDASDDMAGGVIDTSDMVPALDDPSVHFDDDVPLMSPLQLRSAALYLLDQRAIGTLGPSPEYRCDFFNVLGAARYDEGNGQRDVRDVLIDIDEVSRIAVAVDRDECEVIAAITLDEP